MCYLSFLVRSLEALRRKERSEAHLFMTVEVFSDDDLQLHHGPDLIDLDEMKGRCVCVCVCVCVCDWFNMVVYS